MSYERTAITETASAIPSQAPQVMKEPREVNPYAHVRKIQTPLPTQNGQPSITEQKASLAEETKPVSEETVTLSPQMAAFARKEQKFRQEQLALKKQAESLEAERKELAELRALKDKLTNKDFSGIEDLVKYDEYTNYLIEKSGTTTPEQEAVKKLQAEVDEVKKSQKEDLEKRFEAAVSQRRSAVNALVASNEDFSTIKELKAEEHVVQHILDTWNEDSVELSVEQAAKEIENELLERANRWTSLPKLKKKLDPAEPSESKELPPLKAPVKTLTNNMTAVGEIKRTPKPFQHMSDAERYAEARRRAEEKLKQGIRP